MKRLNECYKALMACALFATVIGVIALIVGIVWQK